MNDSLIMDHDHRISILQKREDERQLDIQTKRNEKKKINAEHEQYNYFTQIFQDKVRQVESLLETVQDIAQKDTAFHFDKIFKEIHALQKFVSESILFLRGYDIRICQEALVEIEIKARKLEEQIMPKKKFGFKNKRNVKKIDDVIYKKNEGEDEIDNLKKNFKFEDHFYGFKNQRDTTLSLSDNSVRSKDITLHNLENCIVKLNGTPSTVNINSLINCTVLCGPVATSVFAENCKNCKLVIACQQLRLHCSLHCDIYLHVTSRAIVEDCKNIKVAPYNYDYECLLQDFKKSGLDPNINHWTEINDFNWLVLDKQSPNWSILEETCRITNWNTYITKF